jgi:ABC-type antimicrobial peptide transport system permease subunit
LVYGLKKQLQGTFVGASVASGLALVALLLASLGVFGVVAYVVEERRREIGVRLALGANRAQVRRSIVAAMRWPVIGGLAAGLVFAIIGGFVLRSNLYGLSVLDPVSYLAVAALLSAAAIAATYIPMRRATRVDPAVTLRAD